MFIDLWERGRERNINVREKCCLVASHTCPHHTLNLQPRCVLWPGIKSPTFWCMGWCSNQMSHASQGRSFSSYFPSFLTGFTVVLRVAISFSTVNECLVIFFINYFFSPQKTNYLKTRSCSFSINILVDFLL